ncbi:MAG: HAMP domain-containing histidine kinase [Desulfarculaceae bacterium]|nr:HAMP domain-containing histidine kinase [Desulfarculaceae bacterium]
MGKNEIKTELLIHDIKVPVSVINAGAQSLLARQDIYGTLTEKQEKVIRRILRNAKSSQCLVNDALEIARSSQGIMNYADTCLARVVTNVLVEVMDLSGIDLSDTVKSGEVQELQRLREKVEPVGIKLGFDRDLWKKPLRLEECKTIQILRNLLTNALKYRLKEVEISGYLENGRLCLKVCDDGKGIPRSDRKAVFESYFTSGASIDDAVKSHGVGLAGIMVLLKDMGGDLFLEGEENRGAEFLVRIPCKKQET